MNLQLNKEYLCKCLTETETKRLRANEIRLHPIQKDNLIKDVYYSSGYRNPYTPLPIINSNCEFYGIKIVTDVHMPENVVRLGLRGLPLAFGPTIFDYQLSKLFCCNLKLNYLIKTKTRQDLLDPKASEAEIKARYTLRDMLSESDWRRYVTNGFLMVMGQSGKYYQIFKDQRRVKVYERGLLSHELCIHTDKTCPPTDHVINLKCLVEYDENSIWMGSNITKRGVAA